MPESPFVEHDDWYLAPSFRGVGVGRVIVDHQVTLHIGSDALVIETPFDVGDGSTSVHVVPGNTDHLDGAAALLHAVCRSVQLGKGGELRVEFADDRVLTVSPSEELQSWQIIMRGRSMVVCRPGGDLSFSR